MPLSLTTNEYKSTNISLVVIIPKSVENVKINYLANYFESKVYLHLVNGTTKYN